MELVQHDRTTGPVRATLELPRLAGELPALTTADAGAGWQRVRMTWRLSQAVQQEEVAVTFRLNFTPNFWWAPHLAPNDGDCIAQHVFRSPALIAAQDADILVIVPDLDLCGQRPETPWFMDLNAPERTCWLGMSQTTIPEHVRYQKSGTLTFAPGEVTLGFYWLAYTETAQPVNPWQRVTTFFWERYGRPLFEQGQPLTVPLDRYVEHVYNWAFTTWKDAVWQQFELNGRTVGAPAFIVNVTESPNYPGEVNLREFLSVWNQAWFSSLRGASGLYRYAQRTNNVALLEKANLTKEFALAAPQADGIFPGVYRTPMTTVTIEDKSYSRSLGWESGYWTNSNRTPRERGISDAWYHLLDASWTALLMLRWYAELEADPRLLTYSRTYADRLLTLQDAQGFFPAWLHPETFEPAEMLRQSPETSMSVTFLLKLAAITGEPHYRAAALRAMDAVLVEIVPGGRWEDFETYWSCCGYGKETFYGRRLPRNGFYKQCNFSMFWTAEALLDCYRLTGEERYLHWGRRTLDELSMTQQSWQPPFIYIPALGGFGVMNFDGEWNDSRQCLFAELFMEYYQVTGETALFERGIAALKASFVMMYCPENPAAKALWEKVWPFFGPEDYGFTMENYGHTGYTTPEGGGIGEFTIYDWGNGAAAEARNRIWDHFGDLYVDRQRGHAFGIDSLDVRVEGNRCHLRDQTGGGRTVKVVFEDGTTTQITLPNAETSFALLAA
ncbi:MAG: hypothetical protein KF832_26535 [Caldilineaceae bacterium]|nr:hypothetical protein [Caldilineaceae bacterium]